jgi:predicted ArsR family transcriptional regulator
MEEAKLSPAAMRIVNILVGNPAQTVASLIEESGVTRTAVTEQLNELEAAGFVQRSVERLSGRGRPHHLFSATHAALLLLYASNQQLVVPALWAAIEEAGGAALTGEVVRRASQLLADHYRKRLTARSPKQRLKQMTELLREEGSLAEIVRNPRGHLVLRKRTCPFISMLDESRAVCGLDQDMMSRIVGVPVRRTACRHEGAPCCHFELVLSNGT